MCGVSWILYHLLLIFHCKKGISLCDCRSKTNHREEKSERTSPFSLPLFHMTKNNWINQTGTGGGFLCVRLIIVRCVSFSFSGKHMLVMQTTDLFLSLSLQLGFSIHKCETHFFKEKHVTGLFVFQKGTHTTYTVTVCLCSIGICT